MCVQPSQTGEHKVRPFSMTNTRKDIRLQINPTYRSFYDRPLFPNPAILTTAMTDAQLLQEFEALAERLGIRVSRANLEGGSGGLCTLRGERRIILDRKLDMRTQVEIFAREFAKFPLDDFYIVPRLREHINIHRQAHV